MNKENVKFVCTSCGEVSIKWSGMCNICRSWNSIEEITSRTNQLHKKNENKCRSLSNVLETYTEMECREKTGLKEFDLVLGGGLVSGSLTLIGGEPGVGKSTLLSGVAKNLCEIKGKTVLYVSGEESLSQISRRFKRLGLIATEKLLLLNEKSMEEILIQFELTDPDVMIIDSIQTLKSDEYPGQAGSVGQIKECTNQIIEKVKTSGKTCFVIGHINKEGGIAGPKVLEHMVDTVLYFEGNSSSDLRMIRAIKNRFGRTDEVGLLEIKENGIHDVINPQAHFLNIFSESSPGTCLSCNNEGNRIHLFEVQSLVSKSKSANVKRTGINIESNNISSLVAIIEKYLGVDLSEYDLFINISGASRRYSKVFDLAVIISIISSFKSKPLRGSHIAVGEVSLSGELKSVESLERYEREISKLNFKSLIMAKSANYRSRKDLSITEVSNISEIGELIDKVS